MLDAAQALLQEHGPTALRLDDVAAEVGVSRQAVLHHFGNRDGLMRAVVAEAWTALFEALSDLASARPGDLDGVIEQIDDAVRVRGHGRLGAWLMLSRTGLPDEMFQSALADLPDRLGGDDAEMPNRLLLIGLTLFGDAIFGERIRMALGLPDGDAERAAFRSWLADRVRSGADPEA